MIPALGDPGRPRWTAVIRFVDVGAVADSNGLRSARGVCIERMEEQMIQAMSRVAGPGGRARRVMICAVLGSLIFMLGAAGSKNSPSLPPTVDPSVACKRPKTATPFFPSARARDVLRARLERVPADLPVEELRSAVSLADPDLRLTPFAPETAHALSAPRYLQAHSTVCSEHSTSPPA